MEYLKKFIMIIDSDMDDEDARKELSTIKCKCGNRKLFINFLSPPAYCAGGFKLTCPDCGENEVIYEDYA